MVTSAEFVVFIDYIIKLRAEGVEDDSELTLLFLHIHHEAEERRDQVVFALVEKQGVHPSLVLEALLLGYFGRVDILLFITITFNFFHFFFFSGHVAILIDAKLLTSTLWKSQALKHLLELVLEFSSGTTWSCELRLKLVTSLFDSWVKVAIFKRYAWVDCVDVGLVGDDIIQSFALGQVRCHGRVLRLSDHELIVDQVPDSLHLRFISGSNFFLGHLTPSTLTDDTAHLSNRIW